MSLLDRFRLDSIPILKWKCPFCNRLSPTQNAVVGHILLDHTAGQKVSDLGETVKWARMMANEAEPRWVERRQIYDVGTLNSERK